METYPNQKIVTVHKADADKENIYMILNKEKMFKALTELSLNELKIYFYLASNQNGFTAALSTADIAEKTGASVRKIQVSINSLIEKGYLNKSEGNKYDFVE